MDTVEFKTGLELLDELEGFTLFPPRSEMECMCCGEPEWACWKYLEE